MNSSNNNSIRLALVTAGFWPVSGSTEFAANTIANLAHRAGHQVKVLTIRWEKSWPLFFEFQGIPIHRINRPLSGPWGGFRYLKQLNRLIEDMEPDGILVFGLGDEAYTVTKAFGKKIPIVIRIDSHVLGPIDGKPTLTNRQLASINAADKLFVDSQWTAERLAMHPQVPSAKIEIVADPIEFASNEAKPTDSPQISKGSARVAISDAHPVLMIEPDQPLVVTAAPQEGDGGMLDLVTAWPRVLRKFPHARLWIIGEGRHSRRVWDAITEKQLVHSVIMPGSFDELSDVYCAADIYVHPLHSKQSCSLLKLALAQGTCCVAYENEMTKALIKSEENGLLADPHTPQSMAESLILLLNDEPARQRLARNAAQTILTDRSTQQVEAFLSPFLQIAPGALRSESNEITPDEITPDESTPD